MDRPVLGYLVPEFPGLTHTFFDRELRALERLGAPVAIVSTRRPRRGSLCHGFSRDLAARTTYLAPLGAGLALPTVLALLRAGPRRWWRCVRALRPLEAGERFEPRKLLLLPFAAELAAWARQRGVTHVHSHFCADGANVAMLAYLLGGPTYSITLHGDLRANGPNQRNKWRHAAFGIAVTHTLRAAARAELGEAAPGTWGIAPMGVDPEVFHRPTPYRPYDGTGPLRIFSCGRLCPGKAPDDLLRAVALLEARGVEVSLRIAGEDEREGRGFRRVLEALVADLGIGPRVELLGATAEAAVRDELARAHVYALASTNEALGVATMEAMAMGVPSVATRVGGVPELIEDGVGGLLVEPRHPEHLAAAFLRIAGDPALATALSLGGRRRIEERFDTSRSARTLLELFEGVSRAKADAPALAGPAA